ncbi:MAG: hypothetical protein FJW40_08770 [Acidobacteria bacterium]|nr:hypothetical protein [Acidobacteriota bacterium]
MPQFPILKTGAVAQYPLRRDTLHAVRTLRFVDGTEQRFRQSAGPLKRWTIALALLDEIELSSLRRFFLEAKAQGGFFSFTDPLDGSNHPNCVIEGDEFEALLEGDLRASASLVISEARD